MIELDLPFPVSTNHMYRHVGRRVILSEKAREFRRLVCEKLASLGSPRLCGPLAAEVEVYPPNDQRRDLDNLQKSLLDALQAGDLFEDDSQIVSLTISRRGETKGGAVIVRVREV